MYKINPHASSLCLLQMTLLLKDDLLMFFSTFPWCVSWLSCAGSTHAIFEDKTFFYNIVAVILVLLLCIYLSQNSNFSNRSQATGVLDRVYMIWRAHML